MKKNVCLADKVVRVTLAALLTILVLTKVVIGVWANVLIVLSVVLVVTSLIGFCPLYAVLGINTCKVKRA
jgi:hypothetical protein